MHVIMILEHPSVHVHEEIGIAGMRAHLILPNFVLGYIKT